VAACALAHPLSRTATRSCVRMGTLARALAQELADLGSARSRGRGGDFIPISPRLSFIPPIHLIQHIYRILPIHWIRPIHQICPITRNFLPVKVRRCHKRI
jgi:hypothetical protein